MTFGYECCKKGIRIPSRGATTRRGVWYYDLNIRERGKGSGDRVGSGRVGRMRRRDREESEGVEEVVWEHVVTWDQGELEGEGDHMEAVGVKNM